MIDDLRWRFVRDLSPEGPSSSPFRKVGGSRPSLKSVPPWRASVLGASIRRESQNVCSRKGKEGKTRSVASRSSWIDVQKFEAVSDPLVQRRATSEDPSK